MANEWIVLKFKSDACWQLDPIFWCCPVRQKEVCGLAPVCQIRDFGQMADTPTLQFHIVQYAPAIVALKLCRCDSLKADDMSFFLSFWAGRFPVFHLGIFKPAKVSALCPNLNLCALLMHVEICFYFYFEVFTKTTWLHVISVRIEKPRGNSIYTYFMISQTSIAKSTRKKLCTF